MDTGSEDRTHTSDVAEFHRGIALITDGPTEHFHTTTTGVTKSFQSILSVTFI